MDARDESEPPAFDDDDDDTGDTAFENDCCGICADVVIDRGVLDCCHHWFCFVCIDKWATITNVCPLCKEEFHLITCLPVYDTIGGAKGEEYSLARDEDWCIQGQNNTLSFPSYYIDEDAVKCLEGDQCKFRSGLSTTEEDLTLDTSIACDSCDIWYHAFCVGFNPESATCNSSWLCPRCITDEAQKKSDGILMQNLNIHSSLRSADLGCTIDPSFSGRVSVSIDAGETAVVVSMVEEQQKPETCKSTLSEVELAFSTNKENAVSICDDNSGKAKLDTQLENGGCVCIASDEKGSNDPEMGNSSLDMLPMTVLIPPEYELKEKSLALPSPNDVISKMTSTQASIEALQTSLAPPTSEGAPFSSCYSVRHHESNATNAEGTVYKTCSPDGCKASSSLSHDISQTKNEMSVEKSVIGHHLGSSVSTSSVDKLTNDDTDYQAAGASDREPSKSVKSFSEDEIVASTSEDITDVTQQKSIEGSGSTNKRTEQMNSHVMDVVLQKNYKRKRGMRAEHAPKKARTDGESQINPSKNEVNASVLDMPIVKDNINDSLTNVPSKEAICPDIMSIVQEIDGKSQAIPTGKRVVDVPAEKRDGVAGLRVKKIMRRVGKEKESSIKKLKDEIREVVHDKISNINNDNDFDGKLLTAFRAAIVKPRDGLVKKNYHSRIGAKKCLLQKGKARENLTRKIYGTSTGKRKRAWDRDWEIEFWKHRCMRTKPGKAETLHSVLELLKKATNSCSNDSEFGEPEGDSTSSILSRVYLADASVFPRKDNIKPLSAFAECSSTDNLEQEKEKGVHSRYEKECKVDHGRNLINVPTELSKNLSEAKVVPSVNTGKQISTLNFIKEDSCRKGDSDRPTKPTPIFKSSDFKGRIHNRVELAGQSNSSVNNKRKWAQEVLARKSASTNSNGSDGNEEDSSVLKRKYPLLAQLPMEMRPVLLLSRHKKVPVSVRQAQLYRITEHYLRKANLPVICRTADTELAVADAVNVEKEIFDRSNSKLVYINLCSQAVSQHSNKPSSGEKISSDPEKITVELAKQVADETSSDPSTGRLSNVEAALRLAGLSDSPPSSPNAPVSDTNKEDVPQGNAGEQDLENVLDLDSHPEMDIYGDFEYDLDDENYIGISKLPPQGNGDSKLKVILSTLECEQLDIVDCKNDALQTQSSEEKASSANNHECKIESGTEIKTNSNITSKSCDEIYKEASLAEYEELYGPEKELIMEFSKPAEVEAVRSTIARETENNIPKDEASVCGFEIEGCAENRFHEARAPISREHAGGENSPAHSHTSGKAQKRVKAKHSDDPLPDSVNSVSKKVEAYIKEHIRPLCKSGVITVEQYRWAVAKTTDKVMKYHSNAKNANFLIKEGEKVKKLAAQYVEAAPEKELK